MAGQQRGPSGSASSSLAVPTSAGSAGECGNPFGRAREYSRQGFGPKPPAQAGHHFPCHPACRPNTVRKRVLDVPREASSGRDPRHVPHGGSFAMREGEARAPTSRTRPARCVLKCERVRMPATNTRAGGKLRIEIQGTICDYHRTPLPAFQADGTEARPTRRLARDLWRRHVKGRRLGWQSFRTCRNKATVESSAELPSEPCNVILMRMSR